MKLRLHGVMVAALIALGGVANAQTVGNALPTGVATQKEVVYATLGGKALKLDVYIPPPAAGSNTARAVVLRLAPAREAPAGAAADLLNKNDVLVYAGYLPEGVAPGIGEAGPAARVFTKFPEDIQAAKAAVRWIRGNAEKLGINKERIGAWGAGPGATVAALLGVTPDQKDLNGTLGDFAGESSAIRSMCLFEGITDWRNAELYGDEMVNFPGTAAYQLFGGNPKEHPDEARQASAVNYVRPTSPATLMVTPSSAEQRAMHLIFGETLRKAGVLSALYEEPAGESARAGGGMDETRLNRTVAEFFEDTLHHDRGVVAPMTLEQEVDKLTAAGLYKQARRLIDEQIVSVGGTDAAALPKRDPWLKKLRQINDQQQEPALKQLLAAKKAGVGTDNALSGNGVIGAARTIWTIREVLTDPERIGQYTVEPSVPQRIFESRADAMRFADMLNTYLLKGDLASADRQANVMQEMAKRGDADPAILNDFLTRYRDIKGRTSHVWPAGVHGAAFASDFGQDLYGFWMDLKAGGVTQRLRYLAPGRFTKGSSTDEWGRLPGEPILEPAQVTRGFWLGDSEITQGMWEGVMGRDDNHSAFGGGKGTSEVRLKLPVENASYAHAVNFLNKLGVDARLPTENEWEYACRAGSNTPYSGTGRLSDMGWFWDEAKAKAGNVNPALPILDANGEVDVRILYDLETDRTDMARLTHPVKQKLPNRWGLYDMQGNVWEWCSGTSPEKPRDYHPAKGGSWLSIPQSCRAARDVWLPIEQQSWNVGLRICIPAQ